MDINEIARRAGVSRATVSRYLNNGYVSKANRELIGQIIAETGYVPSRRAQQLRTGKTNLVAVIMPKINSQSVGRMVEGITTVLTDENYQVVLASTQNDPAKEIEYLKLFESRNHVDGIILIATVITPEHEKVLRSLRIPLVVLGQHLDWCPSVYHDDYHAVYDVSRLVLPKAKRPAYLGVFEEDVSAGEQRRLGFVDACADARIELDPEALKVVGFDADSAYFGAEAILDAIPDVDTIVCATDTIAFGAMMCALEYGRRVPQDVQITGIGDSLLSRITRPSLTTVHLPFKRSGERSARMLLDRIRKGSQSAAVCMDYQVFGRMSMR